MTPLRTVIGVGKEAWRHPKVQRAAWAALAAALLDLVVLAFFWMPSALSHRNLEKAVDDHRAARLEAERSLETAQAFDRLSRRAKLLESKWETPVTQAGLVESLTRAAAKRRLKVLSQDFGLKSLPGGGKAVEQNLSLGGDYPGLRGFLDDLDNLPTLTVVRQARLERVGSGGGAVRATLFLSTYQKSPSGGS